MTIESWVIIIGEAVIALFFIAAYHWSSALYEAERKINQDLREENISIRDLNPGLIEERDEYKEELRVLQEHRDRLEDQLNRINLIVMEGWVDD